jgi:Dolichyl-phosphate-mannose-protein mannosyltransferase
VSETHVIGVAHNRQVFTRRFTTRLDLLLILTLAVCIVRFWIMPLPSSLWVDEMGTYFVVHHGANDPTLQAAPQVPASIYYVLPKFAEQVAGFSEVSYRFFSVIAMLGSLAALAWIAGRVIHPNAGWFVIFAAMTSRGFNYQADDARPYALGTFIFTVSVFLLIRWLDSGRLRDGLFFAAAASVLWWVHMVFWPFYLIFAIYTVFRVSRSGTPTGWRQAIAVFAVITCAVVPVAFRAVSLLHQASAHVVVPVPRVRELLLILKLKALIATLAGAFLLSRLLKWRPTGETAVSAAGIALILGWWLIDPLCLFAFSRITGSSLFVARYLYLALPGVALTASLLLAVFIPVNWWKPVALALGLGVLVFMGQWRHPWPEHHNSNWRAAADTLRGWASDANVPVICPSPFIEAQPPVWNPDYPVRGFLYSNLAVYRTPGQIYPFPFVTSPEAERYAQSLAGGALIQAGRFAIYGGDRNVEFWRRWFAARPELSGWRNRRLGLFGDVEVAVFYKEPES